MATVNYSWTLPTVGGSEDTWGDENNALWTALDALLGGVNATEFDILDGATVTTAELNKLDGLTATTAELNILDGVTATAAELNFVDGVTSAIQTQLNSKAPLASPTFTGNTTVKEVSETVYNLTGTAIDPANGTIQYKALAGNTTFTEALTTGQSVTLRIANGASYTVTWPTVTWVGGSAPDLTANDVIVIWQEGTTVYAQYVGSVA